MAGKEPDPSLNFTCCFEKDEQLALVVLTKLAQLTQWRFAPWHAELPLSGVSFKYKLLWKTEDASMQRFQKATVVNEQGFVSDIYMPS